MAKHVSYFTCVLGLFVGGMARILVERRQGSWVNSCLDDLVGVGGRGEDMSVDSQSFFFFFCFGYLSIVAVASKG